MTRGTQRYTKTVNRKNSNMPEYFTFGEQEDEYQELAEFFNVRKMKDIDILFKSWLVEPSGDLIGDLRRLKAEILENGWSL